MKAYLIPPSSNFLKTLVNFFLANKNLGSPDITRIWLVFPTKRACLFFKHYLKIKSKQNIGFLPRTFSFEEFINHLYILFEDAPFPSAPEIFRLFVFFETLEKRGIAWEKEFSKYFNWGLKFLEVFEEFEKEMKLPENLLYPPESLPEEAKKLFEELKENYELFTSLIEKKCISYPTFKLKKVVERLKTGQVNLKEVKEIWIAGFCALRKAELEVFKNLSSGRIKTLYFFETEEPPPSVISETIKNLNLEPEPLPSCYFEKKHTKTSLFLCEVSDPHLEVEKIMEVLPEKVKNPDEIAIVVPEPKMIFPLLFSLEELPQELEVNVTLQYPSSKILLNGLFLLLIKNQKEVKIQEKKIYYSTQNYLKLVRHPLLQLLRFETGLRWNVIAKEIESILRKKGYLWVSLEEVLSLFPEEYRKFIEKFHQTFFINWEKTSIPEDIAGAIKEVLNFLSPVLENLKESKNWQGILLKNYLYILENRILPIFEEKFYSGDRVFSRQMLFEILEHLLKQEKIPFAGDPLRGLQIMGFLETRLLSFKKLVVLDVNEGTLPPSTPMNPLLTDEIKNYFGIPVYKNELWNYYFERLLKSAEEVYLCYVFLEKTRTGEFSGEFKEPSRFIQKLRWDVEKNKKELYEETKGLDVLIFQKKDGIPKSEDIKVYLEKFIENSRGISRYFIETYLSCGVKFYFKYVLKLKEAEKIGLENTDVGNFLHEFFENFFKFFEGNAVKFKEIYQKTEFLKKVETFWNKYEFERKLDALSHFFSKKIAFESINRYFNYLVSLEEKGEVEETKIIGVEKELRVPLLFRSKEEKTYKLELLGKVDYIVKRKGRINKYLVLDFKSNPYISTYPQIAMNMVERLRLPEEYDQKAIYEVAQFFGRSLSNFQLLFYYYLFYSKKTQFLDRERDYIINAGFVTPSDFKKPEKFVFNVKKRGDWAKIYDFFEKKFAKILSWILDHLLLSSKFFFAQNEENCRFCPYEETCKNFKYF